MLVVFKKTDGTTLYAHKYDFYADIITTMDQLCSDMDVDQLLLTASKNGKEGSFYCYFIDHAYFTGWRIDPERGPELVSTDYRKLGQHIDVQINDGWEWRS